MPFATLFFLAMLNLEDVLAGLFSGICSMQTMPIMHVHHNYAARSAVLVQGNINSKLAVHSRLPELLLMAVIVLLQPQFPKKTSTCSRFLG